MIAVSDALLLGPLPLVLLALVQDWYVDVNAPGCPTGTGTQADPFCDIMDAVAAAADGDTIHIAPGTYYENVVLDKDLSLSGTGGEEVTILDGMSSGSVVWVGTADVTLTGLTLTNGSGTASSSYYSSGMYGGGLFADYPDQVTLTSCTVVGNTVTDAGPSPGEARGGGIFIRGGPLTLSHSTVYANNATGLSYYSLGGGICGRVSDLTILASTVSGNTCSGVGGIGGGINSEFGILTLTDSTVSENVCHSNVYGARGGGIHSEDGVMIVEASKVNDNAVVSDGFGSANGGGIVCSVLELSDSIVCHNDADDVAGGIWGTSVSLSCSYASLTLVNSIVCDNSTSDGFGTGGGITNGGLTTITNCTLSGNDGGIHARGTLTLKNSIVWGNGNPIHAHPPGPPCGGTSVVVEYSLVEGGWAGVGNLAEDPLFVDPLQGDFRLSARSPCIDAANNFAVPIGITTDLRGFPRFFDDLLTPDSGVGPAPVVDMGAYEFGHRSRVRRR